MESTFSFSTADKGLLKRDLSAAAIADLERALSVTFSYLAGLSMPDEFPILRRLEALLSTFGRLGQGLPAEVRSWLEQRAEVARHNVRVSRKNKRRRLEAERRSWRIVLESLTLRVLKRHRLATGGPVAARVLALALKARFGIPMGNADGQKQALNRARNRLRIFDPVAPRRGPEGRAICFWGDDWADESLRPVAPSGLDRLDPLVLKARFGPIEEALQVVASESPTPVKKTARRRGASRKQQGKSRAWAHD